MGKGGSDGGSFTFAHRARIGGSSAGNRSSVVGARQLRLVEASALRMGCGRQQLEPVGAGLQHGSSDAVFGAVGTHRGLLADLVDTSLHLQQFLYPVVYTYDAIQYRRQ